MLGFKGLDMALQLPQGESNGYTLYREICKVRVHSVGILEHTLRIKANGYLGLCVLPTV